MQFSNYFILDREHFSECYDQSALITAPKKVRYKFIAVLLFLGFVIMITSELSVAIGLLFIGLAFLEYFSFKYQKAWWLSRQMWSKNSGNKITLNIDDNGIKIESLHINQSFNWGDIQAITETPEGFILQLENNGQSYLSKSSLNEEVIIFMTSKVT